jgi:hypothetical protein
MKQEYDFSKGGRGKFYHPGAEFSFPIYLDSDVAEFIDKISTEKNTDISRIVNDWLRMNISLIQTAK